MKPLIGLVSAAAFACLGVYAAIETAPKIEQKVAHAAQKALISGTRHGAEISVSGRDVTISGRLHDEQESRSIRAALRTLEAPRAIRFSNIEYLPHAETYEAQLTKDDDGIHLRTYFPDEDIAQEALSRIGGALPVRVSYQLAAGLPDKDWTSTLVSTQSILDQLEEGQVTLSDRKISVSGMANHLDARERLAAFQDSLPAGYSLDTSGLRERPAYGFTLRKGDDGAIHVTGNAPKDLDPTVFASIGLEGADVTGLAFDAFGNASEIREKIAKISPILADLKSFDVAFSQRPKADVSVSGVARPNIDLNSFAINRQTADLEDAAIEMPRPFDVQFTLDALEGARLTGLAPEGFDPAVIARNLGIPEISTEAVEIGARGDALALTEQITSIKPIIEDIEILNLGLGGGDKPNTSVQVETLPFADPSRVASFLSDVFVTAQELEVEKTTRVYEEGQIRFNGVSGIKEQYRQGYWVPLITVTDTSRAGCQLVTDGILGERKIVFESGSSTLAVSLSRVVLNRLAGSMQSCLQQTPMQIELAGHTDSVGDALLNKKLSLDRANSVKEALLTRGIEEPRLLPIGYGEEQPIASNDTAQGREQNRRTELVWREQTQPLAAEIGDF